MVQIYQSWELTRNYIANFHTIQTNRHNTNNCNEQHEITNWITMIDYKEQN